MNPAHLFLICFACLAIFWLGACVATVADDEPWVPLFVLSAILNLAAGTGILVSLFQLVSRAL